MPKNIHNLKIGSNPTSQALPTVSATSIASGSFGPNEAALNKSQIKQNTIDSQGYN